MAKINKYYPESVTHPAEILREALEEKNMGSKELAVKAGKPEKTISNVLQQKSSITPEMAVAFEQVLKIPAHFWMEAQKNFDEYKARVSAQARIEEALEWAKSFPYAQMAKLGWVSPTRKAREKAAELLDFFGIVSQKVFEDYYYHQKTQVAFRLSLKNQKNAVAIAAWLRQGELQAESLEVPPYDKAALKNALPRLKAVMAEHPKDFFEQLQSLCAEAGVKVVHTPCLPKTSINGCSRWIHGTPLIQLSGRYKWNDIFWFTFFHEIGHILLHGKKYISIENVEVEGENADYEREADQFAAELILSEEELRQILEQKDELDEGLILQFAQQFQTHPACIVGRLRHEGVLEYGQYREFFEGVGF